MKIYIKEMRIKSWLKNIFIFIPLVFSLELFNMDKLMMAAAAFGAFCLGSSAIYVFNDICDMSKDALHPVKRTRPIACGAISKQKAIVFAGLLAVIGCIAGLAISFLTGLIIIGYIVLNLLYTLWLKHIPIFDCFCIATGFVLRVYAGGGASGESVSDWLFLTVVTMSLFMAFGKRRGELIYVGASDGRDVLRWYDMGFVKGMVFVYAGLSVVFYALWAMNRGSNMIFTVPIIIFIVSEYLLIVHSQDSHGDPTTIIFEDKSLLSACGIYVVVTILLLYWGGNV